MRFPEKEITLKNGQTAILRSPGSADAQEMLVFLEQVKGETYFLLSSPGESTIPPDQEAAFLESQCGDENAMMINCVIAGKIVGNCMISRNPKIKTRHRARLAIAILQDYWNLGIGTALFTELIQVAKNWELIQLELEFIEGNDRARNLYEKMGFRIIGELPNAIRLPDGTLLKEYQMIRPL